MKPNDNGNTYPRWDDEPGESASQVPECAACARRLSLDIRRSRQLGVYLAVNQAVPPFILRLDLPDGLAFRFSGFVSVMSAFEEGRPRPLEHCLSSVLYRTELPRCHSCGVPLVLLVWKGQIEVLTVAFDGARIEVFVPQETPLFVNGLAYAGREA
jgi:hypothetical protein